MTPAGNFFEPWDLPRLHHEKLLGPFRWKMKAFWVCLLYSGSIEDLERFFGGFLGFSFKTCV